MERLKQNIRLNTGERFFAIFGSGVQDEFISSSYQLIDVREAVWHWLKDEGFERIVFFSSNRSAHFLDQHSKELSPPFSPRQNADTTSVHNGPTSRQQSGEASKGAKLRFFSGPRGKERIRHSAGSSGPIATDIASVAMASGMRDAVTGTSQSQSTARRLDPAAPARLMRDENALGIVLDFVMCDKNGPRTAVVFVHAEASFRFFSDQRALAGTLGEWSHLTNNSNICIFLFDEGYADISEIPFPSAEISAFFKKAAAGKNLHTTLLGGPERKELQRLVDYARLCHGVEVEWMERDRLVKWMVAEGGSARQWLGKLKQARQFSLGAARENKWLNSLPDDGRTAWERLDALTGLHTVKQRIRDITAYVAEESRTQGPSRPPNLHMLFTGNPGTGKSTVARLVGEIYSDLGLLQRGHTVEIEREDEFVADHVSGTAKLANRVIDRALDGILFIDEAYRFAAKKNNAGVSNGPEAINQLVPRMENDGHRLSVILAGYTEEIQKLLTETNPGLKGRFKPDRIITFPDYEPDELMEILEKEIKDRGRKCAPEINEPLRQIVSGLHATKTKEFENARAMRSLAESLIEQRALRVSTHHLPSDETIRPEDISDFYRVHLEAELPSLEGLLAELEGMTGLAQVKGKVRELLNDVQLSRHLSALNLETQSYPLHMMFLGNPGTGKTTVAKLMGRIFRALGILKTDKVVAAKKEDLIGHFVGSDTSEKARKTIESALDGVLLLDEVYGLRQTGEVGYEDDVVRVLMHSMEEYGARMVVIAAGYRQEVDHFLGRNKGLRSRFRIELEFDDYTEDELIKILQTESGKQHFKISESAKSAARIYLRSEQIRKGVEFGNGRDVTTLLGDMRKNFAGRVAPMIETLTPDALVFTEEDVPRPLHLSR